MRRFVALAFLAVLAVAASAAQADEPCLECHSAGALGKPRLDVKLDVLKASVHGTAGIGCADCHQSLAGVTDFPHGKVAPVDCGGCHGEIAKIYDGSLHGQEVKRGAKLAPRCPTCHGGHDVLPVKDPRAKVARARIPFLCGSCHKEGTPVTRTYDIPQDKILEQYSESIHGEGLLKRGLTVVAVCIDCHTSHNLLPHTDPRSSINRKNIARTCEQCHGLIEQVHQKVIRGELWQKAPNEVPACVDCHQPHRIRRIFYDQGISDAQCLRCHADPKIATTRSGKPVSLYVNPDEVHESIHRNTRCAQCHTGTDPTAKDRPCSAIRTKVDCSICHAEISKTYATSTHGRLVERGDPNAPLCRDCHGIHGVRSRKDLRSNTFPTNVPALCGQCHREGNKAAVRYKGDQHRVVENYTESIHGRGLLGSGLVTTAKCTDCHTAHHVLPHEDPTSSVNSANLPGTCGKCHTGIYETFEKSIHSPAVSKSDKPLPTCYDCHSSHQIARHDTEGFKLAILAQCGTCHREVTESYFETYHGKASKLGGTTTAKCYDCHGSHDVLPPTETASHLSRQNIVATCGKCHPGSHRRFAGYLTHATHHDRRKYPWLYWSFWFMTILLVSTLTVFGVHTLLWLPRSWQLMKHRKTLEAAPHGKEYRRFPKLYRQLHIMVIVSFLGLAVTGMCLKFSYLPWARWIAGRLGGFESAGFIHRVCAIITFGYFGIHAWDLFRKKRASGRGWFRFIFSGDSMVPNAGDLKDLAATFRWFVGRGPRPAYGRWTYWEKFDYFAVFWGVAIIGATGLMLWFPELFTYILPGWFINVATIVHSDEALLATGFIFTIHFFNTHFRPDRFPMDAVIFTGRTTVEELKEDRPREYEALLRSGELEKHLVDPLPSYVVRGFRIFGAAALLIGIGLILLIVWAEVFGYR
jgi:cytochrome b subunit of formate dehydrogenase